ncbi:hypothetical protein K470DRAFT_272197 [Piedraia hortae CBS 480.64]|uniref:CCHC-type domain-containing protein n=1 Tax=Piedraia hortae CBS 480.64 TaxID=1314780 RepID=A0A6A7BTY7_9PEZI|nr:hypothetical protein K470DRAFT_272197 [Piedraia hortae CBS 480.64]
MLYQALRPSLRVALVHTGTTSCNALKAHAKRMEGLLQVAQESSRDMYRPTCRGKKKKSNTTCHRCGRPGHVQKQCYAKAMADGKTLNRITASRDDGRSGRRTEVKVGQQTRQQTYRALLGTGAAVNCIKESIAPADCLPFDINISGPIGIPVARNAHRVIIKVGSKPTMCYMVPDLTEDFILGLPYI